MQNPDITEFISRQPVALQPIFKALRQIVLQIAPHIVEFMQYRIPFYAYHGRLCYLNLRRGAVELGLCQGAFLSNEQGLLVGEGKQVKHMRVKSLADINQVALQELLQEAMLWNELRRKHTKQVKNYAQYFSAYSHKNLPKS